MANHADFDNADAAHQWVGKLTIMGTVLREAAWKKRGKWAWFILPHGACVAMRVIERDFKKELRISRRETPETDAQRAAWERECWTFLQHLNCTDWGLERVDVQVDGGIQQYYLENHPLSSATRADQKPCMGGCGKTGDPGMYKHFTCNDCAHRLGREEARAGGPYVGD